MSDFGAVKGFEDVWRPVARAKRVGDRGVLGRSATRAEVRDRLVRIAARAPEVLIKITGRTTGEAHLQAHLAYISREGSLPLEGRDGELLIGMPEMRELGADWAEEDLQRRRDSPLSLSVVLSMPPGTLLTGVRDAARAFAAETFGERFDYVFALHTDAEHPHVHLAVRMLGETGERLNPRKGDLDQWRQTFARTLRDREIAAEATPRRARGVVRKPEAMPIRKLRERQERGVGQESRVAHAAREEAGRIARGELRTERPWEVAILNRQQKVRRAYLAEAEVLADGDAPARRLAQMLRAFVEGMPAPFTRRNEWIRAARQVEADRPALLSERREMPDRSLRR